MEIVKKWDSETWNRSFDMCRSAASQLRTNIFKGKIGKSQVVTKWRIDEFESLMRQSTALWVNVTNLPRRSARKGIEKFWKFMKLGNLCSKLVRISDSKMVQTPAKSSHYKWPKRPCHNSRRLDLSIVDK